MPKLGVSLLGTVLFEVDGVPCAIATRKAVALFAYLAVTNRPQQRASLAALLWPDFDGTRAKASLRRALADIKRGLGDGWLIADRKTVQLNPQAAIHADVHQFRDLISSSQTEPQKVQSPEPLMQAIALYQADFLAGFSIKNCEQFDEWQLFEQESLRHALSDALETLIEVYQARGELQLAIAQGRRWVALDPLNEPAQRLLIQLYMEDGQASAALRQYEACKQLLDEELGVEPEPETVVLAAQIDGVGKVRPNNLPPLNESRFIGRKDELAHIQQQIANPKVKLLTLLGMGGTGKTTLALHYAAAAVKKLGGPFHDGIFFVSLAAIWQASYTISATALITSIADALSLSLSGVTAPKAHLLHELRGKDCLLIIDNGESTSQNARLLLNDILAAAPTVKLLITSRERFNLREEWVFEVEGLPYGHEGGNWFSAETLQEHDAFLLFEARAQQTVASFSGKGLDSAEKAAVMELCRLTQGVPLALELAAVWVHMLTCQQIVQEIKTKLDLLQAHRIDLEDRHRSMRAIFDQSWDRLAATEQTIMTSLAVFANSFDYAAANHVAEVSIWSLSQLNEKSLLQILSFKMGKRYRLHPLLRQYILEHLPREVCWSLNERHARYYGAFMQQKEPQLDGDTVAVALDDIQVNIDEIRVGWHWATRHGKLDILHQFEHSFTRFFMWRGLTQEGLELFQPVLALKPPVETLIHESTAEQLAIWSRLLSGMLHLSLDSGADTISLDAISADYRQIAHYTEDALEVANVYAMLGGVAQRRGAYERAQQFLTFSTQISAESADSKGLAHTYMRLGSLARDNGNFDEAQRYFEQSLKMYRELAYDWGKMHALRLLGGVLASQGCVADGIAHVTEGLTLGLRSNDQTSIALAQETLGKIYLSQHNVAQANAHLQQSLDIFRRANIRKGMVRVLNALADLACACGDRPLASVRYKESFEIALRCKAPPLVLDVILGIARFSADEYHAGRIDQATRKQISQLLKVVQHHHASNARQKGAVAELSQHLTGPFIEIDPPATLSLEEINQLVVNILLQLPE